MAAIGNCSSVCVVGMMDQLWFHQAILVPEPNFSFLRSPKHLITEVPELPAPEEPNSSSDSCPIPTIPAEESGKIEEEVDEAERATRASSGLTRMERRARRSCSSSPSAQARPRKRSIESRKRLQKSMSSRSFVDLEMEEVRGFMDLGFVFKRELLSPRIVSVVPGLQRLAVSAEKQSPLQEEEEQGHGVAKEEGEEETLHARPYLSEAWLIKRPDSPLLNLRVPRASPAAEMKQHLRYWAKTVASVVDQES